MAIRTKITFQPPRGLRQKIDIAGQRAFKKAAAELTGRFDAAVSGSHWPWPDSTPRFGGSRSLSEAAENWNTWATGSGAGEKPKAVAGSPRSIVDSGDLKQSRDFNLNGFVAEWNWNVDYAAAVHEGAYIHPFQYKGKLVRIPARPWTTAVLEGNTSASGIEVYPLKRNLSQYLAAELRRMT